MKVKYTLSLALALLFMVFLAKAQIVITNVNVAYTQDFNTLGATANGTTGTALPLGWTFLETGTNANSTYVVDNGVANSGNTYSYGATLDSDRAFGGLLSGSLVPTLGASFTNNSGTIITSVQIAYSGEHWRVGTLNRQDRLDFQYSTDAPGLSTGTYTDVNELDFIAPVTTGTIGALDGNTVPNRTIISFTITGLNIPVGSSFWIRWNDFNASGADDGLAIDDFSITPNGTVVGPCTTPSAQPTTLSFPTTTTTSISGSFTTALSAEKYLVVRSLSNTYTAPVDGVIYPVGATLGEGSVVSSGPANNFSATGLTEGTVYYFFVFSYNDIACSGGPVYLATAPLSASTTTAVTAACTNPVAATNLLLTPATTSVTGNFTGSGAGKYLVIQTSAATFTGSPTNGSVYPINSAVGNGTVVSYSNTTTFTASGLTANTAYYFFVFSANDECAGAPFYSLTSLSGNTTTTVNTIPAGYYDAVTGLACAALKTALSGIITTGHIQNNYGSLDDVQFLTTDDRLNDAGNATIVYDMYSDNPAGLDPYTYSFTQFNVGSGTDGEGNGWNKEHSFPNSWFSSTSSTNNFPGADLHHIFPTDMDVNSLRGNYPFGTVASASTTTLNGSKLGTSAISFPGYSGPVFEPIDAYKGDFARATLYMVTRYQAEQPSWESLQATGDVVMDGTTWPSVEPGYLQMLISWHNADPVSTKEIERNNEVFGYQNNRNPFIDHPEFVGLIWGGACTVVPVTLTSFQGQLVAKKVLLKWTTENPQGFSHFVIEKSTDGFAFTEVGSVASASSLSYDFTDHNLPASQFVYFRLRMVDADGSFKVSQVVRIKLDAEFPGVLIFPNPVTTNLQVRYAEPLTGSSTLLITDARGTTVLKQALNAGISNSNTNVSGLSAGKYFLLITNNKQQIRESFLIIR